MLWRQDTQRGEEVPEVVQRPGARHGVEGVVAEREVADGHVPQQVGSWASLEPEQGRFGPVDGQ
ncbi:hypothetical protein G352_00972 [Rhodococcus ruber BKS 20-38]|uniref:Uncharacterized protein n=1 Tax=Rhodococcus ruber BKS 20-38 TaxID=1278076 RepID=M3A430_9NOCA|nr:hypothetical protein G352_00972 [Rhodococcus ruber BKS 20-38]